MAPKRSAKGIELDKGNSKAKAILELLLKRKQAKSSVP